MQMLNAHNAIRGWATALICQLRAHKCHLRLCLHCNTRFATACCHALLLRLLKPPHHHKCWIICTSHARLSPYTNSTLSLLPPPPNPCCPSVTHPQWPSTWRCCA
jgi:hypothetical protein